jgi:hypothetical protein
LKHQILISILSNFPTLSLLPLTLTSHRIHDLIIRILHQRALEAAQLRDHKLLLECFHPSTKLSTPYLFCHTLATRALTSAPSNQEPPSTLTDLSSLYTSFRPLKPDSDRRAPRAHPAGGWFPPPTLQSKDEDSELVCQDIHLESHELFSQLCTIANLVKVGPKRGLFLSSVNVGEGILRVWRDWLAERAKSGGEEGESEVLWADSKKTVGLRLRVVEREVVHVGPPLRTGEDPNVSYTLFYEGMLFPLSPIPEIEKEEEMS